MSKTEISVWLSFWLLFYGGSFLTLTSPLDLNPKKILFWLFKAAWLQIMKPDSAELTPISK
jgi:hypothetical protein